MHHYLLRSGHDLDLWSNFQNDILRSNDNSFDESRQEEHDAVKIECYAFTKSKVITEILF